MEHARTFRLNLIPASSMHSLLNEARILELSQLKERPFGTMPKTLMKYTGSKGQETRKVALGLQQIIVNQLVLGLAKNGSVY